MRAAPVTAAVAVFFLAWTRAGSAEAAPAISDEIVPVMAGAAGMVHADPDVAFDGTRYLLVWTQGPNAGDGSTDILGARVDREGEVLDAAPLEIAVGPGEQRAARVAFDGTAFVVVWEDRSTGGGDVRGRRIPDVGAPSPVIDIAVGVGDQHQPAIAGGRRANGGGGLVDASLIVWTHQPGGESTARLRWTYADEQSGDSLLLSHPGGARVDDNEAPQHDVDVAFGLTGLGNGFTVVWVDERAATPAIWIRGFLGGGPSTLASRVSEEAAGPASMPAIASSRATELGLPQWILVWTAESSAPGTARGVFARVLDNFLGPLAPARTVDDRAEDQLAPDVVWDGNVYVAAWHDTRAGAEGLYGMRLSADGALLDEPSFLLSGEEGDEGTPALTSDGMRGVLVTYAREVGAARRSRARILRSDLGIACATGAECATGYCVDGVCCNAPCEGGAGDCEACSIAAGGTQDGTCRASVRNYVCRDRAGVCDRRELCDGASRECPSDVPEDDGVTCSDGVTCNGLETCRAGSCMSAPPVSCDDANPCTVGACVEPGGCAFTRIAGCCTLDVDCDDDDACTTDRCVANACVHGVGCPDAGPEAGSGGDAGMSAADAAVDGGGLARPPIDDPSCGCRVGPAKYAMNSMAWIIAFGAVFVLRRRIRRRP